MQELENIINRINELIWTYPMILLLVATHLYLTFKLKFIQKYIFKAMKLSLKRDNSAGMVSNFGALAVSLAATIGTGSIYYLYILSLLEVQRCRYLTRRRYGRARRGILDDCDRRFRHSYEIF